MPRLQVMVEYITLIAVALLILGAVAFLVVDVRGTQDIKETYSRSYWEGARPFAITNYRFEDETFAFEIKNQDTRPLTITAFVIDGQEYTIYNIRDNNGQQVVTYNVTLAPDQKVTFDGFGVGECEGTFAYSMEIEYARGSLSDLRQIGEEPLRGACARTRTCISLVLLGTLAIVSYLSIQTVKRAWR